MDKGSVQGGLEQDARRIRERMPMDLTLTKAHEVADKLREFMDDQGWTQIRVAAMLDVGEAKLNQFLGKKYKARKGLEEMINKSVELINSVMRRQNRDRNKPYIETTVAKRIGTLITQTEAFTDDEGKIGLIIGEAGHGKSHCMRQYAESNKNTIYVELDNAMNSTLMFGEIAKQLGLGIDSVGTLANVTRRLIDKLRPRHIIVMLDEASGLSVKQLDQLRQIIAVKARCPLILAGNRYLFKTISRDSSQRGFESLDQFRSRLICICDLDVLSSDKNAGLYTAEDIRKLYQYGGIRLTSDAVTELRKICKTSLSGRLRTCGHIIAALHITPSVIQDKVIDFDWIVKAVEDLALPVELPMRGGRSPADEKDEQVKTKVG